MNANDDGNAQWLKQPQYCIDVVDLGRFKYRSFLFFITKNVGTYQRFY